MTARPTARAPQTGGTGREGPGPPARFYLLVAIAAVTVDFLLPRVIPGNPLDAILAKVSGGTLTKASLQALKEQFGGDTKTGLTGQYLHFWHDLLTGNLGVSTSDCMAPVTAVIRGALPWTLGLVGLATRAQLRARHADRRPGRLAPRHLAGPACCRSPRSSRPRRTSSWPSWPSTCSRSSWAGSRRRAPTGPLDFPALNATYIGDVLYHAALPAADDRDRLGGRLDRRHAQRDGHHDGRGLRADRAGQGPAARSG